MVNTAGPSGGTASKPRRRKQTQADPTQTRHHKRVRSAADVVAAVARELGIPTRVALAIAVNESGLDPHSVGDGGTSFGLFQLHEGGELGNHTASWAFNPYNNARTALSIVASVHAQHPGLSWGEIAAMAQRPADPAGYAANVNGLLAGYHSSGATDPVHYFLQHGGSAGTAAVNGGGGGGNVSAAAYANSPEIQSQFGYLAAYLNDPVLGPILRDAARNHPGNEGWLLSQLEKTDWWKKTSQTAREMQALQRVDPATYRQQYAQMRQSVTQMAAQMGLHVDPKRLNQISTTALWSGWDAGQIQQAVGAEFHYNPNARYTGTAGSTVSKFKQMAGDYLVPLANHTLAQWTRQILEGKKGSADDFQSYLADQAKTLFPWMAKAIDKGVSPNQYLQPYQQAAAQTLELDPSRIDFTQAKWRRLFETVDPKTGDRSERGLANALTMMRTDPIYGYDRTQQARDEAAAFAQNIAQAFGYAGSDQTLSSGVPSF